jgi:hypothetical protein
MLVVEVAAMNIDLCDGLPKTCPPCTEDIHLRNIGFRSKFTMSNCQSLTQTKISLGITMDISPRSPPGKLSVFPMMHMISTALARAWFFNRICNST